MAAALMKHIEKEKKKLWSVTSSEGGRLDRRPSPTGGFTLFQRTWSRTRTSTWTCSWPLTWSSGLQRLSVFQVQM